MTCAHCSANSACDILVSAARNVISSFAWYLRGQGSGFRIEGGCIAGGPFVDLHNRYTFRSLRGIEKYANSKHGIGLTLLERTQITLAKTSESHAGPQRPSTL